MKWRCWDHTHNKLRKLEDVLVEQMLVQLPSEPPGSSAPSGLARATRAILATRAVRSIVAINADWVDIIDDKMLFRGLKK